MKSLISFQLVFSESCSTCRYIFDVLIGGGELHVFLLCHLVQEPCFHDCLFLGCTSEAFARVQDVFFCLFQQGGWSVDLGTHA